MSSPEQNTDPKLTNPPKETKLTHPPKQQKRMVKIKTILPIRIKRPFTNEQTGQEEMGDVTVTENQQVMVSEEEAKDFCDREFDVGHKNHFGYGVGERMRVRRAERVA